MAGVVIALPPSGGFARWRRPVLEGLAALWVFYFVAYAFADYFLLWNPSHEFCDSVGLEHPCHRPDLIAFQFTATIMQCFMGLHGIFGWHIWLPQNPLAVVKPESRVLGRLPHAEQLCAGILTYQTWDFMASCTMPEHRHVEFLIHHVLTALTAYFSLEFQMMHHYAIFYGGCSEISSMFLVWCDLDRYFPVDATTNGLWATFILLNQASFVLCFVAYRILGWTWYSFPLWRDILRLLPQTVQRYRPGKVWFIYWFLFVDVALGGLQLYWFITGLVPKIIQVATAQ